MKRAPEEELLITNRMRKVPKKRSKKVLKVQITSPPFDGSSSLRWKKCQMRFSCWMPRPKKERKKKFWWRLKIDPWQFSGPGQSRRCDGWDYFPIFLFWHFWSKNLRYPILTLLNIYHGQLTVFDSSRWWDFVGQNSKYTFLLFTDIGYIAWRFSTLGKHQQDILQPVRGHI